MQTFLDTIQKPIIALAPMDGITDETFRLITLKYSNPSFVFTEFVPTDGLVRGIEASFDLLRYSKKERPIVAQLYGKNPENFYLSAQILAELGFDGIDINMGCPARRIEQHGSGAVLIKKTKLAGEIISSTIQGVKDWEKKGINYSKFPFSKKTKIIKRFISSINIPQENKKRISISVKTRIGYDKPIVEEWMKFLSKFDLDMISLHGRTLKQQYSGKSNWEEIKKARDIVKSINPNIIFLGNGDIKSYNEALEKSQKFNLDGVLIGRASIGNPWFFSKYPPKIGIEEISNAIFKHAKLFSKLNPEKKLFKLRKIFAFYVKGLPHASMLRSELVHVENLEDIEKILKNIDKYNKSSS